MDCSTTGMQDREKQYSSPQQPLQAKTDSLVCSSQRNVTCETFPDLHNVLQLGPQCYSEAICHAVPRQVIFTGNNPRQFL